MRVCVIGIGRVGLPLALYMANKGHEVIGVDTNQELLNKLYIKKMPFIEKGAQELLDKYMGNSFKVTSNLNDATEKSDFLIITIGTPVDEGLNPMISPVKELIKTIAPDLRSGHTIILRSTVFPGTTNILKRYIEKETGLVVGRDIFLSFCPERIAEGKSIEEIPEIPQIIGGFDDASIEKSEQLFRTLCNTIHKTNPKRAELAKLFCNMYRYIQFATANQFMMIADDHKEDIEEVRKLVNDGYKRGGLCSPGLAAGPCLYKDGFFLIANQPYTELITSSWRINEGTPGYLIRKIIENTDLHNKKVIILGKGFKRDSDDNRNSLAYKAKKNFEINGANVSMHDPFIKPSDDLDTLLQGADIIFVATNHSAYEKLNLDEVKGFVGDNCLVIDIWNIFKKNKIIFKL